MNTTSSQKIGVIGGGAWGTALAEAFSFSGKKTLLYVRNSLVTQEINHHHHHSTYFGSLPLTPTLNASSNIKDFDDKDVLILAVPAQAIRSVVETLKPVLTKKNPPLIIASKGIEKNSGLFLSEIIENISPQSPVAILSGPSFAHEVAAHYPTALTLACQDKHLNDHLQKILSSSIFRLYTSSDMIGVQIGGALKNVIAIAAGIVIGANLGENARAALITRGLSEISLLGKACKAYPETIFGLSGLGDLLLTAMSNRSRNTTLGLALGRNENLDTFLKERTGVAEGLHTASSLQILIQKFNLDLPICHAVFAILENKVSIPEAIKDLLSRPLKHELS